MAKVRVLSIKTENHPGALADLVGLLADKGVNILALSAPDTGPESGDVKVLAEDPEAAMRIIERGDYAAFFEEALAVTLSNRAGEFRDLLAKLAAAGVNVRYAYVACEKGSKSAVIVLSVSDVSGALKAIEAN
ncbi:MAG: ACT domain-containing protein [bacterium]